MIFCSVRTVDEESKATATVTRISSLWQRDDDTSDEDDVGDVTGARAAAAATAKRQSDDSGIR